MRDVGWPEELIDAGVRVACGSPPRWPNGESGCHPSSRNGQYLGLWQLGALWWSYCGEDAAAYADPWVNARTALCVVRYDLERGYDAWAQWEVKP